MAIMIPDTPREFYASSQEGEIFEALAKLSDDYYVFHSVRITNTRNDEFHESEIDFVILNRYKGLICVEAKGGSVRFENGHWLYYSGTRMRHGGPYNQAAANKHELRENLRNNRRLAYILNKCKFFHAVWFPAVDKQWIDNMVLPPEADKRLTLTKEALTNPKKYLEDIFALKFPRSNRETNLSKDECSQLVREFFCPWFNVVPSVSYNADLKKIAFNRLLEQQARILEFLDEQYTAAVNGAAGTGKTMIAVEKARRLADAGENVLFLCFNVALKDFLEKNYSNKRVSYFTIDGYVCKLCGTVKPNYKVAKEKLEENYCNGNFPYKHVIIDEGQDFGREVIEEAAVIDTIKDIMAMDEGTFYVFYDRLQMVQAKAMPGFISNLDCKMTLYRNCRNTRSIALTSLKPVTDKKPKLYDGAVPGIIPKLYFCDNEQDERNRIDGIIKNLEAEGYKNITILTCKTEESSILGSMAKDGKYKGHTFTTCRKFKGLESDTVILIDVDRSTFDGDNVLLFYVGASRARIKLDITAILSDGDCAEILTAVLNWKKEIRIPKKEFSDTLNTVALLKNEL